MQEQIAVEDTSMHSLALSLFGRIGPLACALAIIQMLLFIAVLIIHIMCIVKGVGGERFLIPGVSQYADRF